MELLAPQQPLRSKVLGVEALLVALPRQLSHEQLARLLWSSDYWPIFVRVLTQFKDVSEPMAALFLQVRNCGRGVSWGKNQA